jgi:hypothetical protein
MVFGHSGADRTEFTQNKQQVVDFSHAISKDIRRTICGATGISAGDAIASIGALGSEAVFKCTHNAPTTMAARAKWQTLALIRHTIGRIHIKCAVENLAGIRCAIAIAVGK